MKSIKVSELTGNALNWAVQHAEGLTGILALVDYCGKWEFSGPIIEQREIDTNKVGLRTWRAKTVSNGRLYQATGETPLIAAMRCYVASKLGDTVQVPEEVL